MSKKKTSYLRIVQSPEDVKVIKKRIFRIQKEKVRRVLVAVILVALAVCGTWLLLKNQSYGKARKAASYVNEISDTNNYAAFADGIVRYNRDGVVFLNRKNEEVWIQPTQLQNPMIVVKEHAFAVADNGGNNILVFTEDGLKGEIETPQPIEEVAISDQGIVTAVLKNENSPRIISYDATGNVLVEQQVTVGNTGYPTAIEMSDDGNILAVSYLYTANAELQSRVGFYNFGEAGQDKNDNRVTADVYDNTVMAEIFFMGGDRSVVVGDSSFVIYKGKDVPEKEKEVLLNQEIQSVFHSDEYIGFVLLNQEKSGYEIRLFDRSGNQVINREFSGEYSHVKLDGDEILLFDGSRCCIITVTGIVKFEGDISVEAMEMFRAPGLNRYYVMTTNELRVIYLTK